LGFNIALSQNSGNAIFEIGSERARQVGLPESVVRVAALERAAEALGPLR